MTAAIELNNLSTEELWKIYNDVRSELKQRLVKERELIDERMRQLGSPALALSTSRAAPPIAKPLKVSSSRAARSKPISPGVKTRRSYPQVRAQYRNPENVSQTWSGRGIRPRWLSSAIEAGHDIGMFRIPADEHPADEHKERRTR